MAPRRTTFAVLLWTLCACGGVQQEGLELSVSRYNNAVRWKRFPQAATFLPETERAPFLARYLAAEEELHIDTLEVRAMTPVQDATTPTYEVTVVAEAYMLPSTVLARRVMTQRWQECSGGWQLVQQEPELVPKVAMAKHVAK